MNIQTLHSSIAPNGPARVGGRLDIRSDAPATAYPSAAPQGRAPQAAETTSPLSGADLVSVLNPQEQQAIVDAFSETRAPVYSGRGKALGEPVVIGTQLDLQA
tara:strand:- start:15 stop:323 length:309 start_codon:yes stop_codon:yes gene_type:complete